MRTINTFALIFALFFALSSCRQEPNTLVNPNNEISDPVQPEISFLEIDLTDLLEEDRMPEVVQVDIQFDHYFKSAKTYQAYRLNDLLTPYLDQLAADPGAATVTFYCTDGYEPTLNLGKLMEGQGYLAFQDADLAGSDKYWPDSVSAKFRPFYLVWENVAYKDRSFPWPYGLYKIRIDKTNTVYDDIYPADKPLAITGFQHFKDYCIKCHSINKIGGNVGPDLNYPKNITDYWTEENIWAYAKDPQSFRYNARMKAIDPLTRGEFEEIVVYLQYMKAQKPLADLNL